MGILDKISEIEKEIARTQKNKGEFSKWSPPSQNECAMFRHNNVATEYHLGLLKAKLAKYRSQLLEPSKSAGKVLKG